MDPIITLCNCAQQNDTTKILAMMDKLGIKLDSEEKELQNKELLKAVMQKWMDASKAIMEMMILHLPSPKIAQ